MRSLLVLLVFFAVACSSAPRTADPAPAVEGSGSEDVMEDELDVPHPPDHAVPIIEVSTKGGRCEKGECFRTVMVNNDGIAERFSNMDGAQEPGDPTSWTLPGFEVDEVYALIAAVDVGSLEEGYGACCRSHADGQDTFITFYDDFGEETKVVRLSSIEDAPQELVDLMLLVGSLSP